MKCEKVKFHITDITGISHVVGCLTTSTIKTYNWPGTWGLLFFVRIYLLALPKPSCINDNKSIKKLPGLQPFFFQSLCFAFAVKINRTAPELSDGVGNEKLVRQAVKSFQKTSVQKIGTVRGHPISFLFYILMVQSE